MKRSFLGACLLFPSLVFASTPPTSVPDPKEVVFRSEERPTGKDSTSLLVIVLTDKEGVSRKRGFVWYHLSGEKGALDLQKFFFPRSKVYDCVVSFSGGKDSCYLLHRLVVDYGLKVLAYTSDYDIPPRTWENIRRTIAALGVDHYVHTPSPSLYKRFIRHLLMNQKPTRHNTVRRHSPTALPPIR